MRLFFATDIHGSTGVWHKAVKSARKYAADVILLGGDLMGKYPVTIINENESHYTIIHHDSPDGIEERFTLTSKCALEKEKEYAERKGYYVIEVTKEQDEQWKIEKEVNGLNPEKSGVYTRGFWDLFIKAAKERLRLWLEELLYYITPSTAQILVMAGNDDVYEIDSVINSFESRGITPSLKGRAKFNGIEVVGLAHVTQTRWKTPREATESELKKMVEALVATLDDPKRSVFNFHCPPYNTMLDEVPYLRLTERVGSKSIRNAIKEYQPILGLHGHVHEAKGVSRIGETLIINPGSAYQEGALLACVIDMENFKVKDYKLLEE